MPPIIIKDPELYAKALDAAGEPTADPAVDLSDDTSAVALDYDQSMDTIRTFGGNYTIPGEVEESATISVVVGADTSTNWAALVGESIELRVKDRADATKYRAFRTEIPVDPSLYGTTEKGEARTVDIEVPVLSAIEWVTGAAAP